MAIDFGELYGYIVETTLDEVGMIGMKFGSDKYEFRRCAFFPKKDLHSILWSCIWTGRDITVLQPHKVALRFLDEKLKRDDWFMPYTAIRFPLPGGRFKTVLTESVSGFFIESVVSMSEDDSVNDIANCEEEVERVATNALLFKGLKGS